MSFQLRASFCEVEDCKSFRFYDKTGIYNPSTNTTGYGTPNIDVSDITLAYLYVKLPGSSNWITYDIIPLFSPIPSSDVSQFLVITNVGLGFSSDSLLPDGYYELWYQIQGSSGGNDFTHNYKVTQLFSGQVHCCVREAMCNVKVGCGCGCDQNKPYKELFWGYQALLGADACGDRTRAEEILKHLQAKCNCTNCLDC